MQPKNALLSVVIPARNEAAHLGMTVHKLWKCLWLHNIPYEIIIVDDHSTDDTLAIASHLSRFPDIFVTGTLAACGYGHAVRAGLAVARGDAIAIVMADGSDDPIDLVRFYRKLVEGYDCVFGSRWPVKPFHSREVIGYPIPKLILNRLANLFISILFFIRYNDVTNAFKLYRRSVIEGIAPLTSQQFNLTVEMPLKAIIKGYKYAVLPNSWVNRKHGVSKFKINEMGSRYMAVIFRCFLESDSALAYFCGIVLGIGLTVLWYRWDRPLTGMHSFRQTQTAISAYWLMKGGPWIAYWTPVMGPPWSIPFEFPFYQWLAAFVAECGLPLDAAGRILSYTFLFLTILPAKVFARDRKEWLIFAILLLASPLYMFWGTAFLMETLALFLSVWFLACESPWAVAIVGTAAALTKITTFFPFWCLAVGSACFAFSNETEKRAPQWKLSRYLALFSSPIIFYGWNWYTDILKARNPIAKYMVSTLPRMHAHNFGTWGQLFSWQMLETVYRGLQDTFGLALVLIIGLLVLSPWAHARYKTIGLCLLGYALPLLVFTNLHIAHNYYDVANAIFLIAIAAILLNQLFVTGHPYLAWWAVLITVMCQLQWFTSHFLPDIKDASELPAIALAHTIQRNTTPDGVVLIYGMEWNPLIPYYAQRKAIMEQSCVLPQESLARAAHRQPDVQAVVDCPSALDNYDLTRYAFFKDWEQQPWGSCTVYFKGVRHG